MKQNQARRFRVRFHLGKGPNFMHWQITDKKSGMAREYYDPDKVEIVMYKAKLGNQPSAARKIFEGADKTVCAWVDCDAIDINYKKSPNFQPLDTESLTQYKYNPRKNPHWFTDTDFNLDNETFLKLTTKHNKIYG